MAAPTLIQSATILITSSVSGNVTLNGVVSGNSLLAVIGRRGSSGTLETAAVSDDQSNTWGQVAKGHETTSNRYSQISSAHGVAGANTQVTVTLSASNNADCEIVEIGAAENDAASQATDLGPTQTYHNSATAGDIDTAADVFVVSCTTAAAGMGTVTGTSGWTELYKDGSAPRVYMQYIESASALADERGTITGDGTGQRYGGAIASFSAVAGGGGSNPFGSRPALLTGVGA